jgi:hypothetical protein
MQNSICTRCPSLVETESHMMAKCPSARTEVELMEYNFYSYLQKTLQKASKEEMPEISSHPVSFRPMIDRELCRRVLDKGMSLFPPFWRDPEHRCASIFSPSGTRGMTVQANQEAYYRLCNPDLHAGARAGYIPKDAVALLKGLLKDACPSLSLESLKVAASRVAEVLHLHLALLVHTTVNRHYRETRNSTRRQRSTHHRKRLLRFLRTRLRNNLISGNQRDENLETYRAILAWIQPSLTEINNSDGTVSSDGTISIAPNDASAVGAGIETNNRPNNAAPLQNANVNDSEVTQLQQHALAAASLPPSTDTQNYPPDRQA